MKVTELLQVAEEAIAKRDVNHDGSFDLCIREYVILCIPTRNLKPTDRFICSLSHSDVHCGLGTSQWDRIFRSLHHELQCGRLK